MVSSVGHLTLGAQYLLPSSSNTTPKTVEAIQPVANVHYSSQNESERQADAMYKLAQTQRVNKSHQIEQPFQTRPHQVNPLPKSIRTYSEVAEFELEQASSTELFGIDIYV
ncbi:hypothetical protein KCM76_07155 [Zooshikella marina]|uniref:hypothetical protein n=1 Tax=Zooshikella ganghwensis TaxID=202772 RepID=UPI001BB0B275|nr:hypothetical protein [Zooshikella ganghwensis]MBU2705753.1 hypothetical protein [Zooshikella ganghwensis]